MSEGSTGQSRALVLAAIAGALIAIILVGWSIVRHLPQVSLRDVRLSLSSTPLPPEEVQGRLRARLYAADFAARVEQTADRIAAQTTDPQIKAACLRWKLGALEAATQAGQRPSGQLALVDAWALSLQMLGFAQSDAGRLAFGGQQAAAVATARGLATDGEAMAVQRLDAAALAVYRPMVLSYVQRNPIVDPSMLRPSIALDWLQAASALGSVPLTTGSIADVASQLLSVADTHLRQLPRALRWRGEVSLLDNHQRLVEMGQVVDETWKEARREGGLELKASAILAAGERLARITGWSWMRPLGTWIGDLLKWVALFTLAAVAIGFGLGWWWFGRDRGGRVSPTTAPSGTDRPSRS